jgi:hypothetical protein
MKARVKMRQSKTAVLAGEEEWFKNKCYTSEGPYLLPFAPNKYWREANIFIVGFNPIASFRDEFKSFDEYWEALTRYPERYDSVHHATYQKKVIERSRTNRRIAELTEQLIPLNVLVTNVFAYPTTKPSLIPKEIRTEPIEERIISRLILTCKPKALFFHGYEARRFASKYFKTELNPYLTPTRQHTTKQILGAKDPSLLLAYHHLVGRVEVASVVDKHLRQFADRIRNYVIP